MRGIFGWDLPPGVSHADIERAMECVDFTEQAFFFYRQAQAIDVISMRFRECLKQARGFTIVEQVSAEIAIEIALGV